MTDASISITNSRTDRTATFKANTEPLETTSWIGINFDSGNDYSVPFQIPGGPVVHFRPDQIDAIKMHATGSGTRADIDMETGEPKSPNITMTVNGQSYNIDRNYLLNELHGAFG